MKPNKPLVSMNRYITYRVFALLIAVSPISFLFLDRAHALIGAPKTKSTLRKKSKLTLRNWGLENAYASHINVRKAWSINNGSREIVVAVIDTGIDPKHPDLRDNLWCKNGNHLKKNISLAKRLKDCEYGWDFVTNKRNPHDNHGHGTHVAGIVGATAKANSGAAGVARKVSIMAIRYYSKSASGAKNLANTIKAIHYAIDNGADIINYSGGGAEFSGAELRAIEKAKRKGILFVAAAGNEHRNTDITDNKYYPGAYGLENIISVAATDIHNKLLPSSNWGKRSVHVAAPGKNIFSTLPGGKYGFLTGTSQGTAFVSGLGALILAENRDMSPKEVRKVIVETVDKIVTLKNRIRSSGRINAYAAIKRVQSKSNNVQLAEAKLFRLEKAKEGALHR